MRKRTLIGREHAGWNIPTSGALAVFWWRDGRRGLLPRVLVWAVVSPVTVLVAVLLPLRATRRLIVPPLPVVDSQREG